MIPAIPPLMTLGTIENVFCWGLLIASPDSEALPAIATDGIVSFAAAAIPDDIGGVKWQVCCVENTYFHYVWTI